jgi:hypothetical protein
MFPPPYVFIAAIFGFIILSNLLFMKKDDVRKAPKFLKIVAYFTYIWAGILIIWGIVGFIVG